MSDEQRTAGAGSSVDVPALVERARSGDRRAFDQLVRCFRPRIYALALHMTGSASEADDVTQDTFVRAFQHLPAFEGRSHFFTWLYRIAIHRALNAKRDGKRRSTQSLDDVRVHIAVQVDAGNDPHLAAELRESYTHLVAAFDQLSPVLRSTVALVALQGLSHKAAASVLETNEGTIAWRIHEARAQLRRTIDERTAQPARVPARKPERERSTPSPVLCRLGRTLLPN
ncbi:MAG TPA: sigma-70 family RNA polymerase sigma factor [Polyangiales bacterium]